MGCSQLFFYRAVRDNLGVYCTTASVHLVDDEHFIEHGGIKYNTHEESNTLSADRISRFVGYSHHFVDFSGTKGLDLRHHLENVG